MRHHVRTNRTVRTIDVTYLLLRTPSGQMLFSKYHRSRCAGGSNASWTRKRPASVRCWPVLPTWSKTSRAVDLSAGPDRWIVW